MDNLVIENAKLRFKNFSGEAGKFNPKGNRNFCVSIDDANVALQLQEAGWNIKTLPPREPDDPIQYYTAINVKFGGRTPPKVVLITSRGKTMLTEENVNILDWAEITNCDLIIRPFEWEPGRIKGYLKSMYVTIYEDEFDLKYSDLPDAPDSAQNVIRDDGDMPF